MMRPGVIHERQKEVPMGALPNSQCLSSRGTSAMQRVLCVLLAVALAATMTILPSGKAVAATTTLKVPVTYGQTEARSMLKMINDFRASNAQCWNETNTALVTYSGLQPLTYDYTMEQVAMLRAAEIAVSYDHTRPNGEDCFSAFVGRPLYGWGENIAAGTGTMGSRDAMFMAWREDNEKYAGQGHRRNMLNSRFATVGIGYVRCNGIGYWVQNFGDVNSNAPATTADNGKHLVDVEVDQAILGNKKLTAASSSLSLQAGASKALPALSLQVPVRGNWPSGVLGLDASGAKWTSSKPSVAAVSKGKVVAKTAGATQLKATLDGATATVTVKVAPPTPALSSTKGAAKKLTVKWQKQTKSVSGYEVWVSTSKKFTAKTTVKKTVAKSKSSLTVSKLKAKKTYYVKVRTYYKDPATKKVINSSWSKVKSVKTK